MTHHFDNLLTLSETICDWFPYHQAGHWIVKVGAYPFDTRFDAVTDDFGNLVPVRRSA